MKEYFKEQLKKALPLTQSALDDMNEGRKNKNYNEAPYHAGDVMLYMMVQRPIESSDNMFDSELAIELVVILESELEESSENYTFSRWGGSGMTIPVFIKKEEE